MIRVNKRSKSKTGCIGCRLRRKKCTEEKPQCAGCLRNGLLCTWVEAGNREHSELLRRTNVTRRPSRSRSPARTRGASPEEADRKRIPTRVELSDSPDAVQTMILDPALHETLRKPQSLDFLRGNPILNHETSRRLLHHYVERTHKVLAVCREKKTPFLDEILPMALSSNLVLNGVLACSGVHRMNQDHPETSVAEATWTHYGQAIQGLKFGLTRLSQGRQEVIVPLLVTTLVFVIVETFRAGSAGLAIHHLRAARKLLKMALDLPERDLSCETAAFLIERYAYTSTLAHLTLGAKSDPWVLDDTATLFDRMRLNLESKENQATTHPLRCIHGIFQMIPQVSVLCRRRQADLEVAQNNVKEETTAFEEYERLRDSLLEWDFGMEDMTHNICGRLYQQALLAFLGSIFEDAQLVHAAFDQAFPMLEAIPQDSTLWTSLGWPLAVFGSCAWETDQRRAVCDRLDFLSRVYGARSVKDTISLLEHLWEVGDPRIFNPLGLERMMKQEKRTILFL